MVSFPKALNLALAILFLLFIACENKFDSSVKTPITHTHDYGHDHHHHDHGNEHSYSETKKSSALAKRFDLKLEDKYNRSYIDIQRDDWQKPEIVIASLGDLKGKTVADIGAGYGYFSFSITKSGEAKKVIAIDIDPAAIAQLNKIKMNLPDSLQKVFEGRVCAPDDPKLADGEADIVLIVNTYTYLENRVRYLKNLKKAMTKGGKLFIVDYKRKTLPLPVPVASEDKMALYEVEEELKEAGYRFVSDDQLLDYQYIIMAVND